MIHQDRLQRDRATRSQQAVECGEVRRPVLLAHGLDHLHADDRVELTLHRPVVLQPQLDPIAETGVGHPLRREVELLAGQGHAGDQCTPARGRDRECAPTGADLEQPGALGHSGQVEDPVDLATLGRLQTLSAVRRLSVEHRAAVAHRRVEESGEELVAQVVVRTDVGACAGERVAQPAGNALVHETAQPGQRAGQQRGEPGGERRQQLTEIGALGNGPVAGRVGLTQTDLRVAPEPVEERDGPDDPQGRIVRAAATPDGAVRVERPYRHARQDPVHQGPGEPGPGT